MKYKYINLQLVLVVLISCAFSFTKGAENSKKVDFTSINSTADDITCIVYGGTVTGDQDVCNGDNPARINNVVLASQTGCPIIPPENHVSYAYQWQEKPISGGSWTDISGQTNTFYSPPATTKKYRRKATYISVGYSNEVTITMAAALDGGSIVAGSVTKLAGATVSASSSTSWSGGGDDHVYEWRRSNTAHGAPYYIITGQTGQNLSTTAPLSGTWYYYRVSISCGDTDAATNNYVVTVI